MDKITADQQYPTSFLFFMAIWEQNNQGLTKIFSFYDNQIGFCISIL